jgi:glycosyltransferase involved in cell wall biosynthesis
MMNNPDLHFKNPTIPRVSVVIPNYNHSRYLKERIESVLSQTFTDYEITILDDASTDNSREIIETYRQNPKVSNIIYNTTNSGSPFRQWEKGINGAKGELIWLAESDDSCEPGFLEMCIKDFDIYPTASFVYTNSRVIDDTGKQIKLLNSLTENQTFIDNNTFIKKYMLHTNTVENASAVLFRKEKISKVDFGKLGQYKWCGDWAFWNYLLLEGGMAYISKPFNKFRYNPAGVTSQYSYRGYFYKEGLPIFKYFIKKIKITPIETISLYFKWGYRLLGSYISNITSLSARIFFFKPYPLSLLIHLIALICLPYHWYIRAKFFLSSKGRIKKQAF